MSRARRKPRRHLWLGALFASGLAAFLPIFGIGCGTTSAPNPFTPDGGPEDGGAGGGGEGPGDAGPDADPTIGGPCADDGQCNDAIDCTFDACDLTIGRCRHTPDDSTCQNAVYCDGLERCDNKLGCVAGAPVSCSDMTPCTIDACDEATKSCKHAPRDVDQDGDPDGHCSDGDDCDDTDPTVSSKRPEVCGNQKDDDCDGAIDEAGCTSPEHDTCVDPLVISAPGSYALDTTGAAFDYASSCAPSGQAGAADVVAAIVLPAGPPIDVEVTAHTSGAPVSVALAGQCGNPASEIACGGSFFSPQGGQIAKLRARSLGDPSKATTLPLYVATANASAITLDVQFFPPTPKPINETCGTAEPITPGVPVIASILDAADDLGGACDTQLGELVYSFTLAADADVDIYAASLDGDGDPSLSLRSAACALPDDEIACQTASSAHIFRHALPSGTYYLAVSANAPTEATVTVDLSPPTQPPPDESCIGAPLLAPNTTIDVPLAGHQDDVNLGCFPGATDAVYTLDLPVASDVLLIERISSSDYGAVELALPACDSPSDLLVCATSGVSPVRASKRNVPAGSYRVIAESLYGQPTQLTALVRKAVPPVLVPFADACADALEIPAEGGFFQGTTANATADFNAGCDQGGLPQGGAPDQLFKLTLPTKKRVVLNMAGSGYNTLLNVRKGPSCPGTGVLNGCAAGYGANRSFLDLTLDAGVYFIQVDGFALDKGPWFLDVRVVDPS